MWGHGVWLLIPLQSPSGFYNERENKNQTLFTQAILEEHSLKELQYLLLRFFLLFSRAWRGETTLRSYVEAPDPDG